MSEYGFPWDSENIGTEDKPVLDRAYEAEQLQGVFKRFFSNGIFLDTSDALQTVYSVLEPTSEVNVWVKGGWCHVNGVFKHFTESTPVTFEPLENPSAQSMRMDEVVLRWDAVARDIIIDVKKGVQAETTNPMPPALTRNELVWELGIALIKQGVGTFDVLDNRLSPTDCGIVAPFESIDTSSLLAELQNAMDATVEAYQDALDGTLAGGLQSQIDEINEDGWVTSDRLGAKSVTESALSDNVRSSIYGAPFIIKRYQFTGHQVPEAGEVEKKDIDAIEGYVPAAFARWSIGISKTVLLTGLTFETDTRIMMVLSNTASTQQWLGDHWVEVLYIKYPQSETTVL